MSFLELSLKLKGFPLAKAENELKCIQSLSQEEFNKWHENKRWEIVRYHFANNNFYKSKIGSKLPDKWEDLPILVKSDYQKSEKNLISVTIDKKSFVFSII